VNRLFQRPDMTRQAFSGSANVGSLVDLEMSSSARVSWLSLNFFVDWK